MNAKLLDDMCEDAAAKGINRRALDQCIEELQEVVQRDFDGCPSAAFAADAANVHALVWYRAYGIALKARCNPTCPRCNPAPLVGVLPGVYVHRYVAIAALLMAGLWWIVQPPKQ